MGATPHGASLFAGPRGYDHSAPASVATSANVEGTFAIKRSVKRLSRASRFVSGLPSPGIDATVSPQAFSSGNGGATPPGGQLRPREILQR